MMRDCLRASVDLEVATAMGRGVGRKAWERRVKKEEKEVACRGESAMTWQAHERTSWPKRPPASDRSPTHITATRRRDWT